MRRFLILLNLLLIQYHFSFSQNLIRNNSFENLKNDCNETNTIHLTQTRMKFHHASSIRPLKKNLFKDEKEFGQVISHQNINHNLAPPPNKNY